VDPIDPVCGSGQKHCPDSGCVDLGTDPKNCGECGKTCDNKSTCFNGLCQ
jgi:hypothetical protein